MSKLLGVIPYTGNKQALLPKLISLFPKESYERFVDAFCGGLSVSLNAPDDVKHVLSNDRDPTLIDMYRMLKKRPDALMEARRLVTEYGLNKENVDGYLKLRDDYNKDNDPLMLYVLLMHSFSNLNRTNDKGEYNVHFGARTLNKSTVERFDHFQANCERIRWSCLNFYQLDIRENDFVYCDPPYLITDAAYNKFWSEENERLLYAWLDLLTSKGIKWGLSNVTKHAGKENKILIEWMSKYHVHNLDKKYLLGQYVEGFDQENTQEVYVCNYENKFTLDDL